MYRQYGFRAPRSVLAKTADEAAKIASEIGFPVALKVASPDILHNTDVGGVALSLASADEVRDAFDRMMASVRTTRPQDQIRCHLHHSFTCHFYPSYKPD